MSPVSTVARIQSALSALAEPQRALAMRAYLRDQFVFLGLPAPVRRQAVNALELPKMPPETLLTVAELLWDLSEREYRYTAVDLLAAQGKKLPPAAVDRLLALARRDPWWDTVDGLAGVVGRLLRAARRSDGAVQVRMDRALGDDCLWVRRIAMLHQLGWRLETDTTRLFAYAEQLAGEPDFFIRKAIGWALRDYARWDPAAVRDFVGRTALSPLSAREALRRLGSA